MEPIEWVVLLNDRLARRRPRLARLDNYYRGLHPLLFASARFQEAFGGRFRAFSDNWISLVVDVVLERLMVRGFRFGDTFAGDRDAWQMWQANNLDARGHLALKEALINGVAYLLVDPNPAPGAMPRVHVQHPSQCIVAHSDADPDVRDAALVRWTERGRAHVTLFLPDGVYRWRQTQLTDMPLVLPAGMTLPAWAPDPRPGEAWPLRNPLGEVPVVPLVNRPRLLAPAPGIDAGDGVPRWQVDGFIGDGDPEASEILTLQDGINKTLMDAFIGSEFMAMPQRNVTGFEPDLDPQTKSYRLPWDSGVDRVWWAKSPDARFGQFQPADLGNHVRLIEMLIQHVASISRTPPHYFGQISGQFPSGESLKSAEAGLVAKAREKQLFFGEGLEEVVRLMFAARGDADRGARRDGETIWADPESRTEGEHIDALLKQRSFGVPDQFLWEKAGYSPAEIERILTLRAEQDAREAALLYASDRDALGDGPRVLSSDEVNKRIEGVTALIRAGFTPDAAMTTLGLDPIAHSGLVPVTVKAPEAA